MIEWTVYFTAILPLLYGACNIRALSPSIKHVYPCSMLLSFVSWWQWSIVLFYVYAEGGELSWRGFCRHRWHWGCRFHNLRCRRWRQGRRRGGSLVSVSVFIVYYMYIDLISRWLALITNKSYCFLFLVSTLNKDFLSYLIFLQSGPPSQTPGGLGQRYWSVSEVTWPPQLELRRWRSSGPSSVMFSLSPLYRFYIRVILMQQKVAIWCSV